MVSEQACTSDGTCGDIGSAGVLIAEARGGRRRRPEKKQRRGKRRRDGNRGPTRKGVSQVPASFLLSHDSSVQGSDDRCVRENLQDWNL